MAKCNKLWTKTAFKNVPEIYAQDGRGEEAIVYVKIFSIKSDHRWYITEYDPKTGEIFALCTNHGEAEFGYSALHGKQWKGEAMQDLNDKSFVPPFERDLHFQPTTIKKIRENLTKACMT